MSFSPGGRHVDVWQHRNHQPHSQQRPGTRRQLRRVDSMEASMEGGPRFPVLLVTFFILVCVITIILCLLILSLLLTLVRHCRLRKLFKSESQVCDSILSPHPSAPSLPDGHLPHIPDTEQRPVDMEKAFEEIEDKMHL